MASYANFFYQVGMLAHTPRSGFAFLGSGKQSVAEHVYRMLNIAFVLARESGEAVDELHLLRLVLFHDLPETMTGDLNYENQKYVREDEAKLWGDLEATLPYGKEIVGYIREFEERTTAAARIAYDADQLEFLLTVKEQQDLGNPRASDWIPPVLQRLKTDSARA